MNCPSINQAICQPLMSGWQTLVAFDQFGNTDARCRKAEDTQRGTGQNRRALVRPAIRGVESVAGHSHHSSTADTRSMVNRVNNDLPWRLDA